MVIAVVGAGTVAFVNLDQGPEPVQEYAVAGDASAGFNEAGGMLRVAASATKAIICTETNLLCQGNREAVKKAEARETKIELSSRAGTTAQQSRVFLDTMNNSLEGAKMVARSEGEEAYYNAIQNGSSLSAAKQNAKQAVKDFYHVKYRQVASSYNILALTWVSYENIESDSGLPSNYIELASNTGSNHDGASNVISHAGNATITAPNGEGVEIVKIKNDYASYHPSAESDSWGSDYLTAGYHNDTFATVEAPSFNRYHVLFSRIDSHSSQVQQAMDTLANQTYDKAISGDLNTSEYLSANTLAREFSQEGNDQAWAAIRLSQMEDVGLPTDMKNIGTVTVTSDGTTTKGVFLSKSNPDSGSFEAGNTYNASKLPGEQMIVQESGSYATLSGEFTIKKITTPDGQTKGTLTIRDPDYQTTNMTEWRNQIKWLQEQRAEINARQQALMNESGGGGGIWPKLPDLPFGGKGVAVVIVAFLALMLVPRN